MGQCWIGGRWCYWWCKPGMGVNKWGVSPLCLSPIGVPIALIETLADGKGVPVVPRDRIELPTRGFSVPCSTD
jgi:hypothetical protein